MFKNFKQKSFLVLLLLLIINGAYQNSNVYTSATYIPANTSLFFNPSVIDIDPIFYQQSILQNSISNMTNRNFYANNQILNFCADDNTPYFIMNTYTQNNVSYLSLSQTSQAAVNVSINAQITGDDPTSNISIQSWTDSTNKIELMLNQQLNLQRVLDLQSSTISGIKTNYGTDKNQPVYINTRLNAGSPHYSNFTYLSGEMGAVDTYPTYLTMVDTSNSSDPLYQKNRIILSTNDSISNADLFADYNNGSHQYQQLYAYYSNGDNNMNSSLIRGNSFLDYTQNTQWSSLFNKRIGNNQYVNNYDTMKSKNDYSKDNAMSTCYGDGNVCETVKKRGNSREELRLENLAAYDAYRINLESCLKGNSVKTKDMEITMVTADKSALLSGLVVCALSLGWMVQDIIVRFFRGMPVEYQLSKGKIANGKNLIKYERVRRCLHKKWNNFELPLDKQSTLLLSHVTSLIVGAFLAREYNQLSSIQHNNYTDKEIFIGLITAGSVGLAVQLCDNIVQSDMLKRRESNIALLLNMALSITEVALTAYGANCLA